jgi:hypothetical protein
MVIDFDTNDAKQRLAVVHSDRACLACGSELEVLSLCVPWAAR